MNSKLHSFEFEKILDSREIGMEVAGFNVKNDKGFIGWLDVFKTDKGNSWCFVECKPDTKESVIVHSLPLPSMSTADLETLVEKSKKYVELYHEKNMDNNASWVVLKEPIKERSKNERLKVLQRA